MSNDLVEQYLYLVAPIARSIHQKVPTSVQIDDLQQAGTLGLIQAARRCRSVKSFKAYAMYKIRGGILDFLKAGNFTWATRSQPLGSEVIAPEMLHDPGENVEFSPRQKRLLARATQAVQHLNPRQQSLLELVYIDGKTPAEISTEKTLGRLTKRRIQQLHQETLSILRSRLAA